MHFLDLFISTHHNYNYDQLCDEIESLHIDEDESIVNFNSRIMKNYYRFHDDDRPLQFFFDKTMLSLIQKSHTKFDRQWFFNELEDYKL